MSNHALYNNIGTILLTQVAPNCVTLLIKCMQIEFYVDDHGHNRGSELLNFITDHKGGILCVSVTDGDIFVRYKGRLRALIN